MYFALLEYRFFDVLVKSEFTTRPYASLPRYYTRFKMSDRKGFRENALYDKRYSRGNLIGRSMRDCVRSTW